jgi:hypothetical protein
VRHTFCGTPVPVGGHVVGGVAGHESPAYRAEVVPSGGESSSRWTWSALHW